MTSTSVQSPAARRPPAKQPQADEADLIDEKVAITRFKRLKIRVKFQTWVIAALGLALILILPVAQPVYLYYAMNPDKSLTPITGLPMPNMTNRAILSWATTNITEIMTMGFGDMDVKIPKERKYFTKAGWDAYTKAFRQQRIAETFKQSQLVLTAVPSNTPVITYQGLNADDVYQWIVQMPVIMTYATNNNVTSKKSTVVTLAIVRVPAEESADGIAIENWVTR